MQAQVRVTLVAFSVLTGMTALPSSSAAQLRLAPVIGDGMVLQRQAAVPVWGWADRGDTVVVTFDRQTYTAVPDTGGRWLVKLPPRPAGGPYELMVAGKRERLQVRDILVGDVWLAAGQSNMAWVVGKSSDAAREIAAAGDGRIRHFKVMTPSSRLSTGYSHMTGAWAPAGPEHVSSFTGVGYFFARELRKSVDVPIGLINASLGSTRIEEWMSPEALRLTPAEVTEAARSSVEPALLYREMIQPLLPFPIKGVLWYQGESNALPGDDVKYRERFAALITDWRRAWGLGDFPFLFVQLANYATAPVPRSWPVLRESQSAALRLPHTAQAVAIDLGEAEEVHPPNKQEVGRRLALAARKVAYGEAITYSGPLYRRHTTRGGRVLLEFDHVGRGLVVGRQGGALQGFAIAGADRQFVEANAKIAGNRVVVWSERVPRPVAVRYAWAADPNHANLYNRDGLPAAPFRTDQWPYERPKPSAP